MKQFFFEKCNLNNNEIFDDDLEKCVRCHHLDKNTQHKIYSFLTSKNPLEEPNVCLVIRKEIIKLRKENRLQQQTELLNRNDKPNEIQDEYRSLFTYVYKDMDGNVIKKKAKLMKQLHQKGAYLKSDTSYFARFVPVYVNFLPNNDVSEILKLFLFGDYVTSKKPYFLTPSYFFIENLDSEDKVTKFLLFSDILAQTSAYFGLLPEYLTILSQIYNVDIPMFAKGYSFKFFQEFAIKAYERIMRPIWKQKMNETFEQKKQFLENMKKSCQEQKKKNDLNLHAFLHFLGISKDDPFFFSTYVTNEESEGGCGEIEMMLEKLHEQEEPRKRHKQSTTFPEVKQSSLANGGLGLFAERDYAENELVTLYGGKRSDEEINGSYVIKVHPYKKKAFYLDGENPNYFKEPEELGRYINESISRRNVDFRFNNRTYKVEVRVRPGHKVYKGEEFFWNYGNEYQRDYEPK